MGYWVQSPFFTLSSQFNRTFTLFGSYIDNLTTCLIRYSYIDNTYLFELALYKCYHRITLVFYTYYL